MLVPCHPTFALSGSAWETRQCGCRYLSQSLNSGVAPVAVGRVGEPWRHWLRWTRLDDVAADGEPIGDRGSQLRDPRSRGPSPDQLDQRSRTAATTLAS